MKSPPSKLRNIRRARTLTQADLARLLGVGQQSVAKYETGRVVPSVDMQARIATLLGVGREDLFDSETLVKP